MYRYSERSGSYAQDTIPWCTTKTLCRSFNVSSTELNELFFLEKPNLPTIYSEINPLQMLKDESKWKARIKPTDYTTSRITLRTTGHKLFTLECNQKAPNWTRFRKLTSLKVSVPTIIGNCCTIPASPTDLNVVSRTI